MPCVPSPGNAPLAALVRRIAATGALLVVVVAVPDLARAAAEDEIERWVPSLGISLGMLGQKAEGASRSSDVLGPPLTTTDALGTGCLVTNRQTGQMSRNGGLCGNARQSPPKLRPDTASSDTSIAPLVDGSLELMTPRLLETLLSPRLFVHGDVAISFAFERNLAGEGRPDDFSAPELDQNEDDVPELAISGQGTRTKSEVQPLVLSAGAGIAFTTDVFARTVRFKPSLEFLRQEVDLVGELHRAVKLRTPVATLDGFRLVVLEASDTEVQHGVGAGLEVDVDAGRLGPFALSFFALGRGYRLLGDLDHTLTDTNEFGENATWDFEFDPWVWRAGAGLRFRWLPE
jgi:hypothetical protein